MGLFTDTQIINDGTADHTFVKRGQLPNPKSLVIEYFEPAKIAEDSKFTVKYEATNSPAQRSVGSSTILLADAEGALKKVTVNTSVAYDKGIDIADVENVLDLHIAAFSLTGMRTRFLQRMP